VRLSICASGATTACPPWHDEGQHKARLFTAALGMTAEEAEDLRALLLQAIKTSDAQVGRREAYGQRDTVDFLPVSEVAVRPGNGLPPSTFSIPPG
jgi:hypothetical protein